MWGYHIMMHVGDVQYRGGFMSTVAVFSNKGLSCVPWRIS